MRVALMRTIPMKRIMAVKGPVIALVLVLLIIWLELVVLAASTINGQPGQWPCHQECVL
jgi:cytosine/uracil/thiamine/allantoin permease